VRWAYDSDRCAVHGGYKRICPAVEEDNVEQEVVPACVVSSLPPDLGFSYFEVIVSIDTCIYSLDGIASHPQCSGACQALAG
jgi:hypothetical protein